MTSLNGPVSVSSPGAPPVDVSSPSGGSVVVAPGQRGPVGPGLELTGTVEVYEDLPSGLGLGDVAHYLVNGDGRLYSWSGVSWPPKGGGAPFKGDQGDRGNGVASIVVAGDSLRFVLTDGMAEVVAVPALTSAGLAADRAESAAVEAEFQASESNRHRANSAGARQRSEDARDEAVSLAAAAEVSASSASSSAGVATTKAGEAATSAAAARQSEINAEQSEVAADASETVSVDRAGVASSAATVATDKAGEAAGHASTAGTYEQEARTSAQAARSAADEALAAVDAGVKPAGPDQLGGVFLPGDTPGGLGGSADSPVVVGWDSKADLVGGKIPTSQIPSVALTETRVVNTSAERLALTDVQTGDVCVQVQNPGRGTYILRGANPGVEGDWQMFSVPTESVTSVNGYNGAVTLSKADFGLSSVDDTSDASKPVSVAMQAALGGKADASRAISAGTGLSGGGDLTANRSLAVNFGSSAGTVCQGNDARLSNARTPTAHGHSQSEVSGLVDALAGKANGALTLVVSTSAPAGGTPNSTITFRTA